MNFSLYDSIIAQSLADLYLLLKDSKTCILAIKPKTKYDRTFIQLLYMYSGTFQLPIYIKFSFFTYLFYRIFFGIKLPRLTNKTKIEKPFIFLGEESFSSIDFFKRPCLVYEQNINIIEQIYDAYYKKGMVK